MSGMTNELVELRSECRCWADCPYNTGEPCPAADGCDGFMYKEQAEAWAREEE